MHYIFQYVSINTLDFLNAPLCMRLLHSKLGTSINHKVEAKKRKRRDFTCEKDNITGVDAIAIATGILDTPKDRNPLLDIPKDHLTCKK
jgi:hypothetical protein